MTTATRPYTREAQQRGLRRLYLLAGTIIGGALGSVATNIAIYGQVPLCMA